MGQTYRVSGTLNHGVLEPDEHGKPVSVIHVYHDGDEFSTEDAALEKELRASKTILLAEEYAAEAASEGNKAPQERLAAERAALEAKVAELEAKLNAYAASLGSLDSQPPASGEPPKSDSSEAQQQQ